MPSLTERLVIFISRNVLSKTELRHSACWTPKSQEVSFLRPSQLSQGPESHAPSSLFLTTSPSKALNFVAFSLKARDYKSWVTSSPDTPTRSGHPSSKHLRGPRDGGAVGHRFAQMSPSIDSSFPQGTTILQSQKNPEKSSVLKKGPTVNYTNQ